MARVNVDGTRRVLDAAAAVGVRRLVRVSSATVYGAWANNPVPLTEDSPLRPNPGFSPAVQAAEVERLLAEWRDDHPGVVVTTLRAPRRSSGPARSGSRPGSCSDARRCGCGAPRPPVQAVHVDDLVGALALVVLRRSPGDVQRRVRRLARPRPGPAAARAVPGPAAPRRAARAGAPRHLGDRRRRRPPRGRAVPRVPGGPRQRPAPGPRVGAAPRQRAGRSSTGSIRSGRPLSKVAVGRARRRRRRRRGGYGVAAGAPLAARCPARHSSHSGREVADAGSSCTP